MGWNGLRPVQEETYRAVAGGADVVVLAPTAGGKTESAFIPVIDALLKTG
ncbi:MAG: DEAD/DEAH box helicase, partial [Candidatus Methanocorpusculum faecipullorum]|nr:DEAD/DEAH box helicase [Candidatus Methanocorpusculum faecipullorum]